MQETMPAKRQFSRIEDYAMIGDCHTAALVSREGSIDWLCLPRFDSPACFAALLGGVENGRWIVAPAEPRARMSRRYLPGTAILETRFETAGGAVTVTDFMPQPPDEHQIDLVRLVRGETGGRIEARQAQPIDRAVAVHERRGARIADQSVVFDQACHR